MDFFRGDYYWIGTVVKVTRRDDNGISDFLKMSLGDPPFGLSILIFLFGMSLYSFNFRHSMILRSGHNGAAVGNVRLLEVLLHELYDVVDWFVMYESDVTQVRWGLFPRILQNCRHFVF